MRRILFAVLCLLVQAGASGRESPVPLSVYGRLPFLEDVTLSPDGSRLTLVRTQGDTRTLFVIPVSGPQKVLAGAVVGTSKLRHLQWEDNDNLLITISSTSSPPIGFSGPMREWYQLIRLNIPSGHMKPFTFAVSDAQTFNVALGHPQVREVDGRIVTFVPGLWVADAVLPGLFSFKAGSEARLVSRGGQAMVQWLVDANGKIASDLAYDSDARGWVLRARQEGGSLAVVAKGRADIDSPDLLGFTPEADGVVVGFTEPEGNVWRPVSLQTGKLGEAFDQGNALHDVITDERTNRIIGGVRNTDGQVVFFDRALQSHWDAMKVDFPDERVHLVSHSADFQRLVVQVFGARDGYQYAIYDWRLRKPGMLGSRYEGLTETAAVERLSYPAADGLTIPGFLTVPRDLPRKNLPLIVFPHGGPAAEDTDDFDWWAQAMAAQGYAVLQPNFRGSTVSQKFLEAGYGEWGRKMQTDLSDGIAYLAKQGVVDPTRVCIVGASYGGYAALAGVTLQSGIYRCAVAVAGVPDLVRMRSYSKLNYLSVATRYWDRFWGVTPKDEAALRAISPIDHVQGVSVPVLLIHGKDDTVVPYEQSERMVAALKKAGKPVEFVTMQHEDHWLSRGETRAQMLEATVAFLRRNNPPD